MKIESLSVFFPAYNEEANIERTVDKALKILPTVAKKWEIIVINDGSKDGTGKIIDELAKKHKSVRALHHKKNRGYGAALKTGFYNSKYNWIVFNDSDGQFEFSEVKKFIKTQQETGSKVIIGYYNERKVSLMRKFNTFLWELVVFLMFGLKVRDIDTAFKLIAKEVIEDIPKLESERGAFISSELLIKIRKSGYEIVEIGVTHYARKEGHGTGANIDVIVKSFVDLFRLWKKL